MILRVLAATFLAAVAAQPQTPAGRWDGTVVLAALKVPFTIYFEGSGTALTGSFVNGEARAAFDLGKFREWGTAPVLRADTARGWRQPLRMEI